MNAKLPETNMTRIALFEITDDRANMLLFLVEFALKSKWIGY